MDTVTFESWMVDVNRVLGKLCGMQADDLPDYDYRVAYEMCKGPVWVAKDVIRNAKQY